MRILRLVAGGILLFVALASLHAQPSTVLGQWDFNSSNLTATVGAPLVPIDFIELATSFETVQINGRPAQVMRFPAASETQGFLATFTAAPNGGGTNLNQYSLLMDILWPGESDGVWRAIFNGSTNNQDDAEIFVNPDNEIGIFNDYDLEMRPETWYRLALVYDLSSNSVVKYLNGTNFASQILEASSVDSRFSLRGGLLLFADNDLETAPGLVNSIQLRSGAMTAAEVAALGKPSSGGLGAGPDPVTEFRIETVQRNGNSIVITVPAGLSVQLQKKAQLTDAAWQNVAVPAGSNFTVPIAEASAFFRAVIP